MSLPHLVLAIGCASVLGGVAVARAAPSPPRPPVRGSKAPARPAVRPPPPIPDPPSAPLPALPVLGRIQVRVARDHVLVEEDVALARGTFSSGDLRFFVAYGAPGVPRAFDARLLPLAAGALQPEDGAPFEPVTASRVPRKPAHALALLGPPSMSGAVVVVREAAFRRATAAGDAAVLRLRTLLDLPPEDARTGREIVVRLGAVPATPLTVARIDVTSPEPGWLRAAEATLCGRDAFSLPLSLGTGAPGAVVTAPPGSSPPVPPHLATRLPADDLCVRVWTASPAAPPGPSARPAASASP